MKELEIRQQIDKLTQQIDATWTAADKRLVALRAEVDRLKLENVTLRELLKAEIPSFEKRYAEILDQTIEKIPPE